MRLATILVTPARMCWHVPRGIMGEIAGVAGASEDCAHMWQVGMDVLPG